MAGLFQRSDEQVFIFISNVAFLQPDKRRFVMKRHPYFIIAGLALLLFSGAAWASEETPAILASLDNAGLTVLDNAVIADIRGQADPQYVMVKILGVNLWDFSRDIDWTLNPFGYRYGYWGGLGWTNGGETTGTAPVADEMDGLFMAHDGGVISDEILLSLLKGNDPGGAYPDPLPFGSGGIWGEIYQPDTGAYAADPDHFSYKVYVSRVSWMSAGGRFFFGWRAMPLTEYARREAVLGMGIVTALP